jgi:hypothetical protein
MYQFESNKDFETEVARCLQAIGLGKDSLNIPIF